MSGLRPYRPPPTAGLGQVSQDWQRSLSLDLPSLLRHWGNYPKAKLPTAALAGDMAYCTDGRKVGEGAGAGTGVPVYFSNTAWRVYSTDAPVAI